MNRAPVIIHRFVEEIPAGVEPGVLYVSIVYATAVHRCPGCDRKVVTPFAPGSWHLVFDGETVSIKPSIANVAHACNSHYWIANDRIVRERPLRRGERGIGRLPGTMARPSAAKGRRRRNGFWSRLCSVTARGLRRLLERSRR